MQFIVMETQCSDNPFPFQSKAEQIQYKAEPATSEWEAHTRQLDYNSTNPTVVFISKHWFNCRQGL